MWKMTENKWSEVVITRCSNSFKCSTLLLANSPGQLPGTFTEIRPLCRSEPVPGRMPKNNGQSVGVWQ